MKQVRRAAGKSGHVQIIAYDEDRLEPWWQSNRGEFGKIGKLSVVAIGNDDVQGLAQMVQRNMKLAVTIQDGTIWVSDDTRSLQIDLRELQSEHQRY